MHFVHFTAYEQVPPGTSWMGEGDCYQHMASVPQRTMCYLIRIAQAIMAVLCGDLIITK